MMEPDFLFFNNVNLDFFDKKNWYLIFERHLLAKK